MSHWRVPMVPMEDDLGAPLVRGICHGDGLLVDIQTDVKRARVTPWLTSECVVIGHGVVHDAALAAGKLTRGVNRGSA